MRHVSGPLCLTLRDGHLASCLLGESQRRSNDRAMSPDYEPPEKKRLVTESAFRIFMFRIFASDVPEFFVSNRLRN
jgi:hypothetical protein